jgi:hypothetical protein
VAGFFAHGAQGTLIGETNHGVLWKKWASVTGAMLRIEFLMWGRLYVSDTCWGNPEAVKFIFTSGKGKQ